MLSSYGTDTSAAATALTADAADDLAAAALALARRCSSGATMWCIAPVWVEHARHVAVEFVHPVVMGTRALPAVAVDPAGAVDSLRAGSVGGDVLVLVGDAGTPGALDLLRRARAWGLTTLWIGAGDRPRAGAADHVLWVDDGSPAMARHDGSVTRLYHLLWELTHVCLEHTAVLVAHEPLDGEVCVTCSDEAHAGEVLTIDPGGLAEVRTACGMETVDTTLVGPIGTGDLVLVHAGTAITVLHAEDDGDG
jgi:hydrogenase maturation factor